MKSICLILTAVVFAGCANEPAAKPPDARMGGTAGVTFASANMSRVAPTRPGANAPAN